MPNIFLYLSNDNVVHKNARAKAGEAKGGFSCSQEAGLGAAMLIKALGK